MEGYKTDRWMDGNDHTDFRVSVESESRTIFFSRGMFECSEQKAEGEGETVGVVQKKEVDDDGIEIVETTAFEIKTEGEGEEREGEEGESTTAKAGKMVSSGIEKTATLVSTGLVYGAGKLGAGLKSGSTFLKSRLKPNEEEGTVSALTKTRVHRAKQMSGVAESVSKTLVTGVIAMSSAMASSIAYSFSKTDMGKKFESNDSDAKRALKNVGAASINAFETLLDGMTTAGLILVKDTAHVTSDVMEHKYGKEVGKTAREIGDVVENMAGIAVASNQLRPSRVIKATMAQSAVKVLTEKEHAEDDGRGGIEEFADGLDPSLKLGGKLLLAKLEMEGKEKK
eukprot:TRINITY_DN350_c0_g3_i6.p1 TRINITY_DN350_c0_g3~~TRINITY_DN350_c0_g3_i6.p1  ORF type:complete len:340 (-),score=89.49 TRINITY_DN350_c0_g3_i6:27-1046(-)